MHELTPLSTLYFTLGSCQSCVLVLVWRVDLLLFGLGISIQLVVVQCWFILGNWSNAHHIRGIDAESELCPGMCGYVEMG